MSLSSLRRPFRDEIRLFICISMMSKENPLITQVFEMKERDDMSVEDIAAELGLTKRQIYYFHTKALIIGRKYNIS